MNTRMSTIRFALALAFALGSMAFSASRNKSPEAPPPVPAAASAVAPKAALKDLTPETGSQNGKDFAWVARPDGAKQCENTEGQSLDAGLEELKKAKIDVLESKKGDDGMMRIQLCGAPAGKENTYKIRRKDLAKARALGFQETGGSSKR